MQMDYDFDLIGNPISDFYLYLPHRKKRDESNELLSANLDKLVQEESKTNFRLDQV